MRRAAAAAFAARPQAGSYARALHDLATMDQEAWVKPEDVAATGKVNRGPLSLHGLACRH